MERFKVWGEQLLAVLEETLRALLTYLPAVLTAAAVLALGWLLAVLARGLVRRAVGGMEWLFDRFTTRAPDRSAALTQATSRTVASIVYWIVLLIFAVTALRILGGESFERWTANLLGYLPFAIGGIAIIVVAFVGGALVRQIIEHATSGGAAGRNGWMGRLAQGLVVLAGFVMGLGQIGIDVSFLVLLTSVAAGAALGGIALAFALGSRGHLANLISAHYARKRYSTGDRVRVAGFEGRIVEIADGLVFLESEEGDVALPAHLLARDPLVKLRERR
ncbi:MAG TPA: hypothetical protein VIN61_06185 [Gammaproteobacteria bacterium]